MVITIVINAIPIDWESLLIRKSGTTIRLACHIEDDKKFPAGKHCSVPFTSSLTILAFSDEKLDCLRDGYPQSLCSMLGIKFIS